MLPELDVIICANIYHRVSTIKPFIEALFRSTNPKTRCHLYLVANWDENFPKGTAVEEINYELQKVDWKGLNTTLYEGKSHVSILETPNLGLSGFNLGLEIGRTLNVPVLCMNDDTLVCEGWERLLEHPKTAIREGKEVPIRRESIGVIGPCYYNCGSMRHQQYKPDQVHYSWTDFIVGHAQLVTPYALKKGFRYDSEICLGFGPYDIAQSMILLSLELNLLVNHSVGFDFPESRESHFHEGNHAKFDAKLGPIWQEMQERLECFQQEHKAKYNGVNKWYFE